jgi:hypothetical protein
MGSIATSALSNLIFMAPPTLRCFTKANGNYKNQASPLPFPITFSLNDWAFFRTVDEWFVPRKNPSTNAVASKIAMRASTLIRFEIRDSEKAGYCQGRKHVIPWMIGDLVEQMRLN